MGPFKRHRHQWQRPSVTEQVSAVAKAWVSACSKLASRQRRPLVYFTYRGNKERGPGSRSSRVKVWMNLEPVIGEGDGTPLQYSCLENPMDGGSWWAAVHGVVEGWTRLSDFTFTFHFHALKEMATHSSVLAWRIPGTGEPGGLPSMGSHRVRHN